MVGTMIVMAYAGVQTVGALTAMQMAAAFAINFAVSQIVTRVFGQDQAGTQDNGVRQQVPPSTTNAMPVAYGDVYMGGTFVDAVLTTDQKTMYYVLAVSSISPNGQFSFDLSKFYYGDRLITFAASGYAISASVFNGGSGYVVGDVLTVSGGTPTTATQLTVTQVSSGVITAVSVSTAGSYAYGATPNNPASVTGGTGNNAKFVLKFSAYGPTVQALCDEAGNIDTKINGPAYLQISLFTSDQSGTVTKINTTDYPWDIMGVSEIPVDSRWPSTNRRMNGLAFAIVRLYYSQDAGTTNLSPITFHCSHYLNGAGCAKPGDVWYDYITNKVYGGAVGWLPDGSFSSSFVDASSATTLNDYSDELITFNNSSGVPSTQPRYRMNGVLDAGQTVLTNIDKIMSCCDSWMTYNSALGQWSVVVNKPETAAYSFDDDNIIGDIRVSATDITSSINQVEAKFPFKENRDQPSFVQLATPSNLLYPNEPANKYSITYDLVNESVQASYLANRLLEQAREDLIVSFSTTYYGIQVDAGSVVSVTNSAYGWSNKLFRVIKVNEASLPDGSLGAKLELSEYNVAVYDNFDITAFIPAPNSGLPSVNYFSALSAPVVSTSNPSSAIPNFDVSISIPATGRVTSADLFYTTAAIPGPTDWKMLATATSANGVPVTPSSTYLFTNQVLPTGSSTTTTYYFAYVVYNNESKSTLSPISSAFSWTPVAARGPTGPTGAGTAGLNGLSFINAYKVQSQSDPTPTFTTPTSGATIPSGWTATAPSVSVGQVLWYIQGQYNSSSSTIDGVAANTTAWTGPIAASIFQDIRSDNWNGSTPPSASSISTWGTTGYYIDRTNGNMFANGFYARGVMKVNGSVYNPGIGYTTALDANPSAGSSIGVTGYTNVSGGFGLVGWTDSASSYSGIIGTSVLNGSVGVIAANNGGGVALNVSGKMTITNNTLVTNLNADLLDGQHASSFVQVASGTSNDNYFYYVNNTTSPSNPTTPAAWIKVSTNSGGVVWFPGYF